MWLAPLTANVWRLDMSRRGILSITLGAILGLVLAMMAGCQDSPRSERWIGTYSFPNHSTKFPLYLDIRVEGKRVSGRAFDGSMEEAAVSGTVNENEYDLLLHPLKQGTSSEQDIHYRARRAKDSLVGEWEHVIGVRGPWAASITELAAKEALKLHPPPCEPTTVAQKAKSACGKDA